MCREKCIKRDNRSIGIGEWMADNVILPVMLLIVMASYWVRNLFKKTNI